MHDWNGDQFVFSRLLTERAVRSNADSSEYSRVLEYSQQPHCYGFGRLFSAHALSYFELPVCVVCWLLTFRDVVCQLCSARNVSKDFKDHVKLCVRTLFCVSYEISTKSANQRWYRGLVECCWSRSVSVSSAYWTSRCYTRWPISTTVSGRQVRSTTAHLQTCWLLVFWDGWLCKWISAAYALADFCCRL